jgi:hypothetical protein
MGITPRDGKEFPPMLLVQDSCSNRPVFQIGLDLFMDMGIHSKPCTVPLEWAFNENADYMVSQEAEILCGGSLMALDDKGVPYIINTEESIQVQRKEMSRYLDVVTVKPDERVIIYR